VISFDPNVRPTLIKDRDAYLARMERMIGMSDIVKLSDDDLAWLAPDGHFEAIAADWLDKGAQLIILTRGAEGATVVSRDHSATIPGVDVEVVDTIGAGDTFSAATLARLDADGLLDKAAIARLDADQLGAILAHAAAAAAITASRPGADPPWRREME
jgi:fructokinase